MEFILGFLGGMILIYFVLCTRVLGKILYEILKYIYE